MKDVIPGRSAEVVTKGEYSSPDPNSDRVRFSREHCFCDDIRVTFVARWSKHDVRYRTLAIKAYE